MQNQSAGAAAPAGRRREPSSSYEYKPARSGGRSALMAGTTMAVPLLAGEEPQQQAWKDAYSRLEARPSDRAIGTEQGDTTTPAWRRTLGLLCVIGIPVFSTASGEFGQYMEMRLVGGPYAHGYIVSWANHSILIVFLIPWAMIVASEKGCSCSALWGAMVRPYGTANRLIGVTFWLSFQYQLFNCEAAAPFVPTMKYETAGRAACCRCVSRRDTEHEQSWCMCHLQMRIGAGCLSRACRLRRQSASLNAFSCSSSRW